MNRKMGIKIDSHFNFKNFLIINHIIRKIEFKMEDEIFVRIEEFPDYYVSNLGRVLSLKFGKERFLKPAIYNGYYSVVLLNGNIRKLVRIHRLVAKAFIPNPYNLPEVNHKDENKLNNCVDNLEWCTSQYNNTYGTSVIRRSLKYKKKVGRYSLAGELLKVYDGLIDAEKDGFSRSNISHVLRGKCHTHHGYRWKFID